MSGAVALLPPYAFMPWTGTFPIFYMRATCRAHHVMRLLCSVKLPSFKFLPADTSRVHTFSRHTALLSSPPQSASPTHYASFVYRNKNGDRHFLSSTLGKFNCPVSCCLVSPPSQSICTPRKNVGEWRYGATHS